ncbi:MAG: autotransporter domain-containing protein, partial [Cetobacterium sp.]
INKGIININSTSGNGLISKGTGTILNDTTGVITLESGNTAMTIRDNGTGENKGKLIVNYTNAQAVSIFGGKFVNSGTIENNSNFLGQGIFATAGEVENSGIINMNGNSGTGVFARDNAKLINSGTINLNSTNNTGISVLGTNAQAINTNTGVINLNGTNGVGVSVSEGAKFTNNGQIVIKAGTTGNRELLNNGGTILNKGLIKSNDVFEIDSRGIFEIGKNGVIEAKEVIGNIKLSNDLTFNNYSDVISEEILKTENYQGNITSDSVLYNTTTEKTENGYAVNLERKEFTEILENQGLANYLESNYTNGTPKKDKFFNELKLSKSENSLNSKINNVFGNNIFPNLKKQTLDLINHTKETLIKNVFKSKATKEIRTIAGYDYKKNEVKSSENLSGYDETVNSIFLGMDKGITQNLRVGGVLTLGELNSNYTLQNANRKDSNLQANIFTQYEKNGLNYVFNGFIGGTNGELKRKVQLETINSKLSTNLESRYIGFNNIVSKKIDKNGFILEPQFQVNATYLKMN